MLDECCREFRYKQDDLIIHDKQKIRWAWSITEMLTQANLNRIKTRQTILNNLTAEIESLEKIKSVEVKKTYAEQLSELKKYRLEIEKINYVN